MYTAEMDPTKGPVKISAHEAARQRAEARALKGSKAPPRSQSPTVEIPVESQPTKSMNPVIPRSSTPVSNASTTVPKNVPPRPTTPVATVSGPQNSLPVLTKGKATKKGAGKKAAKRPAVPEATQPIQAASRAGSLRPGAGRSGQTDTCVASSHPSKTRVRNLFPRGGFFPPANSAEFNRTARQPSPV
jgi:hypothetical protein